MSTIRSDLINNIAGILSHATALKHGCRTLAEEIVDEVLRNLPVKSGRNYTVDKAIIRIRDADDKRKPISIMDCEIVFAAYHSLTETPQQMNTDLFKPIPDEGGWYEWAGGLDAPITPGTRVEAQLRNGRSTGVVLSNTLMWEYDKDNPQPWDIVKYRPLSESNYASYLDMPSIRDRIARLNAADGNGGWSHENCVEVLEIAKVLLSEADKLRDVTAILLK